MHYAISTTWGPTDTTRASLPFIFAASALQANDTVMIMLLHDAVAVAGAHQKMLPFGPPQKFEEVFSNPDALIIASKPCAEVRGIIEDMLVANCTIGGMNDFHEHVSRPDCKAVSF